MRACTGVTAGRLGARSASAPAGTVPCCSPGLACAGGPAVRRVLWLTAPASPHPQSSGASPISRASERTTRHLTVISSLFLRAPAGGGPPTVPSWGHGQIPASAARSFPGLGRCRCRCRTVSYTHLRAHETRHDLVCRLLLEK